MYFDRRLWSFTAGVRHRIWGAVLVGPLTSALAALRGSVCRCGVFMLRRVVTPDPDMLCFLRGKNKIVPHLLT